MLSSRMDEFRTWCCYLQPLYNGLSKIGKFYYLPNRLPSLHGPECSAGLAVDFPVCVSVIIANGDGEPSVVCPDDVQVLAGTAADVQSRTLASISRQPLRIAFGPGQSHTWKAEKISIQFLGFHKMTKDFFLFWMDGLLALHLRPRKREYSG